MGGAVNEFIEVKYGRVKKLVNKKKWQWDMKPAFIAVQYARLVHQFKLEITHANADTGHESLRRQTYAQTILDAFGEELDDYHGFPIDFRSKVFTPVLQRQLRGVSDSYAPSIRTAIAPSTSKPTISQVTSFYLGNDPLDPRCIPSYRRNLLYIREVWWHLGVLMGKYSVKSVEDFNRTMDIHDVIIEALRGMGSPDPRGIPKLNEVEVATIYADGLQDFFRRS